MTKVTLPPLPIKGGCQCGQLRYALKAKPVAFLVCHCTNCQRHTSSAFGESLFADRGDVEFSGRLASHEWTADSGNRREGLFCPDCGTRLWHGSAGRTLGNIKAGTLDDPSWLVPAAHIWTRSKQPFLAIPADALTYETQPTDGNAAILARWAEMTS
ncbi:MAG: GFA family protein [Notoacmeibacter sp.]|nr:GFA family protein [Notoacmeibacter sp.]